MYQLYNELYRKNIAWSSALVFQLDHTSLQKGLDYYFIPWQTESSAVASSCQHHAPRNQVHVQQGVCPSSLVCTNSVILHLQPTTSSCKPRRAGVTSTTSQNLTTSSFFAQLQKKKRHVFIYNLVGNVHALQALKRVKYRNVHLKYQKILFRSPQINWNNVFQYFPLNVVF
jgi:hypothetical protein